MKKLIFASFLFVIMLLPVSSFAGAPTVTLPPVIVGCCQYSGEIGMTCEDIAEMCPAPPFGSVLDGFFLGESCNETSGLCSGSISDARNVPALGEWGLIAMAAVMGIIGFIILRRKKVTA